MAPVTVCIDVLAPELLSRGAVSRVLIWTVATEHLAAVAAAVAAETVVPVVVSSEAQLGVRLVATGYRYRPRHQHQHQHQHSPGWRRRGWCPCTSAIHAPCHRAPASAPLGSWTRGAGARAHATRSCSASAARSGCWRCRWTRRFPRKRPAGAEEETAGAYMRCRPGEELEINGTSATATTAE